MTCHYLQDKAQDLSLAFRTKDWLLSAFFLLVPCVWYRWTHVSILLSCTFAHVLIPSPSFAGLTSPNLPSSVHIPPCLCSQGTETFPCCDDCGLSYKTHCQFVSILPTEIPLRDTRFIPTLLLIQSLAHSLSLFTTVYLSDKACN